MAVRDTIEAVFQQVMMQMMQRPAPPLRDDLILLNSGLDSLGFAALIARLEDELGVDPFSASVEAFYPVTMGEFVACYEQFIARLDPRPPT